MVKDIRLAVVPKTLAPRVEVHVGGTYRVLSADATVREAYATLKRLRLTDDEIGKVLVCLASPDPHRRAVTVGLCR